MWVTPPNCLKVSRTASLMLKENLFWLPSFLPAPSLFPPLAIMIEMFVIQYSYLTLAEPEPSKEFAPVARMEMFVSAEDRDLPPDTVTPLGVPMR
jgi:hypothetical protein